MSTNPLTFDLTPPWYDDYELMLDIVHPNRTETVIFDLEKQERD